MDIHFLFFPESSIDDALYPAVLWMAFGDPCSRGPPWMNSGKLSGRVRGYRNPLGQYTGSNEGKRFIVFSMKYHKCCCLVPRLLLFVYSELVQKEPKITITQRKYAGMA